MEILFEDEWLIAINKEAGHLVHPADLPQPDDIVCMKVVRDHLNLKIYPTHRLDRPTCGALLFAKNKTIARAINRAFERKQVEKIYHAVVEGSPPEQEWRCEEPLQKTPDLPWKEARTSFRVIESLREEFTLLEATPETGRYHQIRKHLLHCGHPIIGDYRYAGLEKCEQWNQSLPIGQRMLLQCRSLTFAHPADQTAISIEAPEEQIFRL